MLRTNEVCNEQFRTARVNIRFWNRNPVNVAIDFAGIDHIVAGSDYPHQIGSIPKMISSIGERADIFAANAARILKG